jgi:hypothetical protein
LFELALIGEPGVGQNLNHKNADHLFFGIDPEARVSLERAADSQFLSSLAAIKTQRNLTNL